MSQQASVCALSVDSINTVLHHMYTLLPDAAAGACAIQLPK
jgi:hypothetical protein